MAMIKIPYGRGEQVLNVPDERLLAVLCPEHGEEAHGSESDIVRTALENPVGSVKLRELVKGKQRIVLITSDHTRPVPSHITMPLYLEEIRKGNPDADITILIATGMHRPTTEEELRAEIETQKRFYLLQKEEAETV